MIVTEKEASSIICQETRGSLSERCCIARECMAWVWLFDTPNDYQHDVGVAPKGYCGLVRHKK